MSATSPLIDDLAARLRQRRQELAALLRQRLHQGDDQTEMAMLNYFGTPGDEPEANRLTDIEVARLGHDMAELRDIDLALRRIASGGYGQCERCGEDIAEARLRAQPWARLCPACQARAEHAPPSASRHPG